MVDFGVCSLGIVALYAIEPLTEMSDLLDVDTVEILFGTLRVVEDDIDIKTTEPTLTVTGTEGFEDDTHTFSILNKVT